MLQDAFPFPVGIRYAAYYCNQNGPLDLRSERKYSWNVYFCCVKETGQPTAR